PGRCTGCRSSAEDRWCGLRHVVQPDVVVLLEPAGTVVLLVVPAVGTAGRSGPHPGAHHSAAARGGSRPGTGGRATSSAPCTAGSAHPGSTTGRSEEHTSE